MTTSNSGPGTSPSTNANSTESNSESSMGGIVIGVDGSEGSRHALDWLVSQQHLLEAPIVPVAAFSVPATADGISPLGSLEPPEKYRAQAEANLTNSVEVIDPSLIQSAKMILEGHAGSVLVDAARGHSLLVVGCRGRSALAETLLGSVGSYCVKHSDVPVVIVPQDVSSAEPVTAVIVGVDGSANSQAALQWAVETAGSSVPITAVGVFSPGPYSRFASEPGANVLEQECRDMVQGCLGRIAGEQAANDASRVQVEIHEGDPRSVLRDRAAPTDLLVVGARGYEGVAHLLLGSVATSLTYHPTVATAVVPNT